MGREEVQLSNAKRSYRNAKAEGNRQEEARWANVIGDILKNRGEYVEALKWFRIDYEISDKYLLEKHLLPTCQSLGEVYLRLQYFQDALIYQKKHLELAKDANDLIEQQRASTQLGRTYHDMFIKSNDDHYSARNAKKYFKSAMKLAEILKENPPTAKSSYLKEYIDAHNNIGMLEIDLDNLDDAKKILTRGLEICDEEEIDENDDGRSRLHHNLGIVYMDLRLWDKARKHIEKDIIICKRIEHCQGEAKGYINLGELHYRVQKYEEAIRCYQKAFDLANSMEDEDVLTKQIDENIEIVREAMKVMDELKKEEQNLKKLTRIMNNARGTPQERKYLLKQNALLDSLIEKSSMIFAWLKHREFAKRKKRIAAELCDKEKLCDSFLAIGESYQKLRKFDKAIKWFTKSLEAYKSIGNLEGQAMAKINIGGILDCGGDWVGALNAFEEGHRIAVEANLPSVQLSALENMHYSHMIRFDNVEEARRLKLEIDNLKQLKSNELERKKLEMDCCSETDTEEDDCLLDGRSGASPSMEFNKVNSSRSKALGKAGEMKDDMPLISLFKCSKRLSKKKTASEEKLDTSKPTEASPKCLSKTTSNQQTVVGRKRIRVVLSDDEGEMHDEMDCSNDGFQRCPIVDLDERKSNPASSACKSQDFSSKCAANSCYPVNIEESTCSYKSLSPNVMTSKGKNFRSLSSDEVFACGFAANGSNSAIDIFENIMLKHNTANLKLHNSDSQNKQRITFRIDNDLIHVEAGAYQAVDMLDVESMKVELACLYYLRLPLEKRSKGLLPIIQDMKCSGRVVDSLEAFESLKDDFGNVLIEVSIDGWIQKRLMKLYLDCCKESSETPNMKLLKKLYVSEVEDEVIASECELQDISITPLLNALQTHKAVALLDLSHNLLGNGTMEKLQQFFTSGQRYGDLTLDLHCNRFGPTALFQICECPVLFTRLEALNISGNHLTDACGSYLSTILENCKALYSLNIERCSITSRTIQKVGEALNTASVLSQLCIGYNSPVSGNAIINLLTKLASLKSFAELNLNGLKLNKPVVDSLCQLAKTTSLSRLMLGSTGIGTDGALKLTESLFSSSQESVKLDLSYCGLADTYLHKLNTDVICSIIELNLGGNSILQEGRNALVSLLTNPQCYLKVLIVNNCQLGITGVLQIIQAVAENTCLEELHLADNVDLEKKNEFPYDQTAKGESDILQPSSIVSNDSPKTLVATKVHTNQEGSCAVNTNQLEVADSEDDQIRAEPTPFELNDSCTSSCQKKSSLEYQYIRELSTAIGMTKHLQLLDLSNNGFSAEVVDALYASWSCRLGGASARRHIKDQMIHFSVETNKCCKVKPCCRKD